MHISAKNPRSSASLLTFRSCVTASHVTLLQQREVHNLKGHESYVFCLCTTPHSQVLISGSYDEHVRIWDLRSGSCVRTIEAHSDPVTALDTHKDGTQFVSGSHDGLLYASPLLPRCVLCFQLLSLTFLVLSLWLLFDFAGVCGIWEAGSAFARYSRTATRRSRP